MELENEGKADLDPLFRRILSRGIFELMAHNLLQEVDQIIKKLLWTRGLRACGWCAGGDPLSFLQHNKSSSYAMRTRVVFVWNRWAKSTELMLCLSAGAAYNVPASVLLGVL